MHRVELKVHLSLSNIFLNRKVPNAPCGVERLFFSLLHLLYVFVPNAPCGVESALFLVCFLYFHSPFLMHRVELKVHLSLSNIFLNRKVPNAPCGVERALRPAIPTPPESEFLMHRVELKETHA